LHILDKAPGQILCRGWEVGIIDSTSALTGLCRRCDCRCTLIRRRTVEV
jgi:hypothetical protein